MDEKVAVSALKQVKEVLDKYGVEFWLDSGTLLGAVRDGKFIPWDGDIDLGIWDTQISKISASFHEFRHKEFDILFFEWKGYITIGLGKDCPIQVMIYCLSNDKATQTEFMHFEEGKRMRQVLDYLHRVLSEYCHVVEYSRMPTCITKILYKIVAALPHSLRELFGRIVLVIYEKYEKIRSRAIHISVPSHYFTNLSTIRFYGMEFRVPAETEEYLAYRYGKGWKIPKEDYIYYEEDGAIAKNAGN